MSVLEQSSKKQTDCFFDQIEAELLEDKKLKTQAKANKLDTSKGMFMNKLTRRMGQDQDIYVKILENQVFYDLVKELMMKKIYRKMNE